MFGRHAYDEQPPTYAAASGYNAFPGHRTRYDTDQFSGTMLRRERMRTDTRKPRSTYDGEPTSHDSAQFTNVVTRY